MKKLYILILITFPFVLSSLNGFSQSGNPKANFNFNPATPCTGSPTTFRADTFGLSNGFFTYYDWRIDNSYVGSGVELITSLNYGYHDVQLTVNDSLLQFFDDTTMTIFVDSICNLSTISGTAYYDVNGNGTQDSGELGVNNGKIRIDDGSNSYYAFCSTNGIYSLQINTGSYDVTIDVPSYYSITEPSPSTSYQVNIPTIGSTSSNNDFGINTDSVVVDKSILLSNTPLRPGFTGHLFANIRNLGTYPDSGTVVIFLDTLTPFVSSIPGADSVNGNIVYYSLNNLLPNGLRRIRIETKIDSTVQLNTPFNLSGFVFPVAGDVNPLNNVDTLSGVIVGSYDPNDKLVFPNDDSTNAFERGTPMTYTIRFQNTGTFFAENVRLVDQIEPNLDLNTFQMLGASHSYTYQINSNGKIVWRFDGIMLPAEQDNEPESHGFVKFRIDVDSTLSLGDTVYNSAEIYFDFNLPIITNTIVSTLDTFVTVSLSDYSLEEGSVLNIYPNPFKDEINIELVSSSNIQFELFSMQGDRILIQSIENQGQIKMKQLSPGMYLYKAIDDSGKIQRGKLIKN